MDYIPWNSWDQWPYIPAITWARSRPKESSSTPANVIHNYDIPVDKAQAKFFLEHDFQSTDLHLAVKEFKRKTTEFRTGWMIQRVDDVDDFYNHGMNSCDIADQFRAHLVCLTQWSHGNHLLSFWWTSLLSIASFYGGGKESKTAYQLGNQSAGTSSQLSRRHRFMRRHIKDDTLKSFLGIFPLNLGLILQQRGFIEQSLRVGIHTSKFVIGAGHRTNHVINSDGFVRSVVPANWSLCDDCFGPYHRGWGG